jgi:hypothetical protein
LADRRGLIAYRHRYYMNIAVSATLIIAIAKLLRK